MKWMRNRFLLLPYIVLLTVLSVIGCTSKQEQSETLPLCGNHSCGDLVMVTTDTSSDGFHYLNPSMSPDGERILFTADWWAIPSDPRYTGDDGFVNNRQLILISGKPVSLEPKENLASQGAELIFLLERDIPYAGGNPFLIDLVNDDKSNPSWYDNDSVIFSLRDVNIGSQYRICKADISDPSSSPVEFLYMEPSDATSSPLHIQHLEATLSPKKDWLAFTRSQCVKPDSFRTCSGVALWVLEMASAGDDDGYSARAFPVTGEYSRIETPSWSSDGRKIVFSGGMDVAGAGVGAGTEIFSIDFDAAAVATDTSGAVPVVPDPPALDDGLKRLTFTSLAEGDPIAGILNYSPVYDGDTIYFVSTRRAPSITLHERSIWRIPANGSLDPVMHYFTRSDDVDPTVLKDGGGILLSSALGFPTEMLNRLENEAYQGFVDNNPLKLSEVQLRALAADSRRQLELFMGVMSHIYIYRP